MSALFPKERENVRKGLCAVCSKPVKRKDLKNEISKKEFDLTGFCQKCQDDFYRDVEDI